MMRNYWSGGWNKKGNTMNGSKETVRVAMIGAGAMANTVHYPSLASFDDVEIAAICDLDPSRLTTTADKYGVRGRYTNYRQMVDEVAPDGVYVIGQPHLMYDVWVWCLQQGLNLYIEKPLGLSWHQAQMLAHLAEDKHLVTQVSHQRRSSPLLVRVREECLKRGPMTHALCEFYKSQSQPELRAYDHMLGDCTHSIDTVRWMCGGEVVSIESRCKRVGTPDINWIGIALQFDNGATGYVINSWCSGRRVFRVQMHALGIAVDAEVEGQAHVYADGDYQGVVYDARQVAGSDQNFVYGGFQAKNREFIDSLKTGQDVTSSPFRDCVKTMEVAEKVLAVALLNGQ
jgi:virulence factor